jgi:hypothetical protein
MPSYKIKSEITVMGKEKVKMDVEFISDDGSKLIINGYEVDKDTDAGIHEVLSRAAQDIAVQLSSNASKTFNLPLNQEVSSSESLEEVLKP